MKTEKEVKELMIKIQRSIEFFDVKMLSARGEFEYNTFRDEKMRKLAQYSILSEVLK